MLPFGPVSIVPEKTCSQLPRWPNLEESHRLNVMKSLSEQLDCTQIYTIVLS